MTTIVFYRLETDFNNPQFSICTEQKGDLYLPYYRHDPYSSPDPNDPCLPHLQMFLARAPEPALMPKELFAARLGRTTRRKPIDPKRIPDLWSLDGIALASESFLDAVGEDGRAAVEVSSLDLYDFATGHRFPKQYYTLVARHVAKPERLPGANPKAISDARVLTERAVNELRQIVQSPKIIEYLQSIPIWVLFNRPRGFYFSPDKARSLIDKNLNCMKEFNKSSERGEFCHVWTDRPGR